MAVATYKQQTRRQWNRTACGEVAGVKDTLDYFLRVERNRYQEYAPWLHDCFLFDQFGGCKVLEIGFGQGTDLVQFAKAGAECHGVEITENHFELARANFEHRQLTADLRMADANSLPYDDDSFDVVYSFGVLHHTPETNRCVGEAYRVLKPGGKLMLGLYHRHSFFHWVSVYGWRGLLKGELRRLGYDGLLATVEQGADGSDVKPLVKVYSKREMRVMLADFSVVRLEIHHLQRETLPGLQKCLPNATMNWLASKIGWYVVANATK